MLALVTDSTAALSRDEARALGVDVVETAYVVDGRRYLERYMGESGDYASLFRGASEVRSEAVRPSGFLRAARSHMEAGDDVLIVTISSRLSGAYRSALEAASSLAREFPEGPRVASLDSWGTAGSLEFTLRGLRELASDGAGFDEVLAAFPEMRARARVAFTVPDLDVLGTSGRLGAFSRAVMTKLRRYPVMGLDEGAIVVEGIGRGARGCANEMARLVPRDVEDVVILHFGEREEAAMHLLVAVRDRLPHARIRMKDGGPVLSRHLGLGSVAVTWEVPRA